MTTLRESEKERVCCDISEGSGATNFSSEYNVFQNVLLIL